MLPRENKSYDYHYVTKENQPFEYQCGHIVTTSIKTIIDFNSSDQLIRWNSNKVTGICPRCEKTEELKMQHEKIQAEKDDCYNTMEWNHQILVDHSLCIIFYRTFELCKSIDNEKYPRIYKEVVELMEKIKEYEKGIENMDSTFEFYKINFTIKQCTDILNEHIAKTTLYLTSIHSKLTYIIMAIYENPSHLSDVERNFIHHKANLILASMEAEYKRRDIYKEYQKELNEKVIHFTQDIVKTS